MENKTDRLEYKNYMNSLFDIYGELLTEKQIEYFKSYYFEDLSLREIASSYNVSSNAIYDQIKNIEKTLEKYESILGCLKKNNERQEKIEKIEALIENVEDDRIKNNLKHLVSELNEIENK